MSLLALALLLTPASPPQAWQPLFNGHDLSGWTPKITHYPAGENFANTFRVEDGVLKVSYDGYGGKFDGRFGHLFYKTPYSNYKLRLEYRFVGKQIEGGPGWAFKNSGIMIHGQTPESMRVDQDFPVSCEVQLLGGDATGDRPTGNVCTPGTNIVMGGKLITQHCTNSISPTFRGEEWVSCEVEVHGAGLVIHRIDGKEVLRYEQIQFDPNDPDAKTLIRDGKLLIDGGTISLQSESHPVEFRRIEIQPLKS
ncbi:MAG: DUF1080 domain-containing protein [Fimbriimonadaceae bacterium]|nr:DUF1080 domain-containing protein [Fimbriimonadaceae bacterium]